MEVEIPLAIEKKKTSKVIPDRIPEGKFGDMSYQILDDYSKESLKNVWKTNLEEFLKQSLECFLKKSEGIFLKEFEFIEGIIGRFFFEKWCWFSEKNPWRNF